MKILKNDKGITLVALVITMIIIMILTVTVTVSMSSTKELNKYYKVKEDIIALTDEVQRYYMKNNSLPVIEDAGYFIFDFTNNPSDRNPNDNSFYYYINTELLDVEIESTDSTYIVNEQTLTVYIYEGVELNGQIHYTIVDDSAGGKFADGQYSNIER